MKRRNPVARNSQSSGADLHAGARLRPVQMHDEPAPVRVQWPGCVDQTYRYWLLQTLGEWFVLQNRGDAEQKCGVPFWVHYSEVVSVEVEQRA